jgi:hypothetical protein
MISSMHDTDKLSLLMRHVALHPRITPFSANCSVGESTSVKTFVRR